MIVLAAVFCCLGLFIIFCKMLEERVNKVVGFQKKIHDVQRQTHERISSLEVHEHAQDARLDRTQNVVRRLREDVNEMGKDIGWKDDDRKTQVMKQKNKDPDDAA